MLLKSSLTALTLMLAFSFGASPHEIASKIISELNDLVNFIDGNFN